MIEITAAAADSIQKSLAAGKVVRMFLAGIDPSGASYGLGLGDPEEEDMIFESRGIKIHMDPKEAELLSETVIDYIDDGVERGFVIRGPEDEPSACSACANADTCDHDHSSSNHDHNGCYHNHGTDEDTGCGCC
ncbi:MAG TPA: iron-sulfur cluster biosynthesis family protein [Methanothrix sp.]|jgi:iron-sulfur cluster assembly protein|nr:adhesin [Methanothrix sp.]HOV82749.1 iron-sulfur cluster biosynthesis family protein [Methanothrix sp.]HPC89324.1 iron-sulfur cluster biosynthesis family protein [Methanothrix sp.]HQE88477.1 iron-sulfur cluster biosynthesis family protein [Methanothrix sp.]HQI68972.1 iron-sulfur cluster biosynthesis family protein [Methanothrix sp.]